MSDVDLQALCRKVQVEGDPPSRLRAAVGLERAGRPEEALRVLLPAREDLAVRTEIARIATSAALPLRSPRVRWWIREAAWDRVLAASPLGIVCGASRQGRLAVLDPESGRPRWERPWPLGSVDSWPVQVGTVLVGHRPPHVLGLDVWTGAELHVTQLDEACLGVCAVGDRLVGWSSEQIWSAPLPDPRCPPGPKLWSSRVILLERASERLPVPCVVKLEQLLLSRGNDEWSVLDEATGERLGFLPGEIVHADESGILVRATAGLSYFVDPLRPAIWARQGVTFAAATSEVVMLERDERHGPGLEVVEKRTGHQRDWFSRQTYEVRAAIGDVILATTNSGLEGSELLAVGLKGDLLWREWLGEPILSVTPWAPRQLVTILGGLFDQADTQLVCLEEEPREDGARGSVL